jgi:4-aminobutyrate aminotransferase / (S)-3-amino-2-methylpropionate transaminase / 5-aminovalerate transaminase
MGTAVAVEVMKMMRETDYEAMVMEKGAYFLEGLRDLQRRHKIVGDVDGLGLALRMEICEPHDSFTPAKAIVDRMVDEGLKGDIDIGGRRYGLVLDIGGYYKNVVTLAPSLHISREEMDVALKLMDVVLGRATRTRQLSCSQSFSSCQDIRVIAKQRDTTRKVSEKAKHECARKTR